MRPFTVTRPEAIISSARRREVIPARAMIFCRRSSMEFAVSRPRGIQLSGNDADREELWLGVLAVAQFPEVIKERTGAWIYPQITGIDGRFAAQIHHGATASAGLAQGEHQIRLGGRAGVVADESSGVAMIVCTKKIIEQSGRALIDA